MQIVKPQAEHYIASLRHLIPSKRMRHIPLLREGYRLENDAGGIRVIDNRNVLDEIKQAFDTDTSGYLDHVVATDRGDHLLIENPRQP